MRVGGLPMGRVAGTTGKGDTRRGSVAVTGRVAGASSLEVCCVLHHLVVADPLLERRHGHLYRRGAGVGVANLDRDGVLDREAKQLGGLFLGDIEKLCALDTRIAANDYAIVSALGLVKV